MSSSRAARRKTVGDLGTADNDPPVLGTADVGIAADYNVRVRSRLPAVDEETGNLSLNLQPSRMLRPYLKELVLTDKG